MTSYIQYSMPWGKTHFSDLTFPKHQFFVPANFIGHFYWANSTDAGSGPVHSPVPGKFIGYPNRGFYPESAREMFFFRKIKNPTTYILSIDQSLWCVKNWQIKRNRE